MNIQRWRFGMFVVSGCVLQQQSDHMLALLIFLHVKNEPNLNEL